ncbi:MAG: FAD-dependent monooxygenase [Granulosicoccus sp.]
MNSPPGQTDADIVIVGAGLIGTPLAHALSRQGWSVVLLDESSAVVKNTASGSGLAQRCTALNLGTRRWLQRQGLWRAIEQDACPIEQVTVSHKGYFGATRLRAADLGVEAVGYVVNNEHMAASFVTELGSVDVRHVTNARVESVALQENCVRVYFGDSYLDARLLIAADGVSSIVRESLGIATRKVDYEQAAVLATVALEGKHDNIAYERFTASGPLAMLPRPGRLMSFVDCVSPAEADAISAYDDAQYLQRLQRSFGFRLGRFTDIGPRFVTSLVRIESTSQTAQRTVLLGSAMRLLHPVGGQGYNLAMRDVAQLQQLLSEHRGLSPSADPGAAALLAEFVRQRKIDQHRTVSFTDALARSFRGKASLPGHFRALGLIGLDTVSPLRRRFSRFTMGLGPGTY